MKSICGLFREFNLNLEDRFSKEQKEYEKNLKENWTDRDEVIEYFIDRVGSDYVDIRQEMFDGKITYEEYRKKFRGLFENFEKLMEDLGVSKYHSSDKEFKYYMDKVDNSCEEVRARKMKYKKLEFMVLCLKQYPHIREYVENYKIQGQ